MEKFYNKRVIAWEGFVEEKFDQQGFWVHFNGSVNTK